jgi:hypothetical protein
MRTICAAVALLAGCASAASLDYAADRDERRAQARATIGDGVGAAQLYHQAASERAQADLQRIRHHGYLKADVLLE